MATVSGVYMLKPPAEIIVEQFTENVNFTLTGRTENFAQMVGATNTISGNWYNEQGNLTGNPIYSKKAWNGVTDRWAIDGYFPTPIIDFGAEPQIVSETFVNWLAANTIEWATYALFNDVRLPKIPELILKYYPYAWIRQNINSGHYELFLCETARYYKINTYSNDIYPQDTSAWYRIEIANADNAIMWEPYKCTTSALGIDNARTVLWSNHDIPNGSATATNIYFEGTEPVPIEETPEEPTTPTVITYNGNEIATLEAGQTATIKTAETEVDHDIVITPAFPIEIAYGDIGIIGTAEAGQTAIIKTANTEIDHDIVVSAKAEEEEEANYLTFSSPSSFTLATGGAKKNWNGKLEYSTDAITWNTWNGATTLSADDGKLYLRGTGNTYICNTSYKVCRWVLTGSNIACEGNIENLLDYTTVASGEHPTMTDYCFAYLFHSCSNLISAPSLPATRLATNCYYNTFYGCGLVTAPALPATILPEKCYYGMFEKCESLITAPALPATALSAECYRYMFQYCTSLTSAPALPATTLTPYCYNRMFYGCTNIKISTTQTEEYKTAYRIPASGEGTTANEALYYMFKNTGGTFTETPSINTTYYTSNEVVY